MTIRALSVLRTVDNECIIREDTYSDLPEGRKNWLWYLPIENQLDYHLSYSVSYSSPDMAVAHEMMDRLLAAIFPSYLRYLRMGPPDPDVAETLRFQSYYKYSVQTLWLIREILKTVADVHEFSVRRYYKLLSTADAGFTESIDQKINTVLGSVLGHRRPVWCSSYSCDVDTRAHYFYLEDDVPRDTFNELPFYSYSGFISAFYHSFVQGETDANMLSARFAILPCRELEAS